MIPIEWIDEARQRITAHIVCTPLLHDERRGLYFKLENRQVTGSFKARGALNKVLSLQPWERERGIVTASAGNHGQGVALAGQLIHAPVEVFVAENAVLTKVQAIQALGAKVHFVSGGYAEAELAGKQYASETKKTWISAYNDGQVIAGQGTLALEIADQMTVSADQTWLVPVSGGGLLAGIAVGLQRFPSRPRLIGVQAEASAFMHALYYRGTQVDVPDLPSLADGLTGAVEEDALTIPIIKKYVDDILLVSEDEIASAVAFAWHTYGEKFEPSGAVGLAAVFSGKVPLSPTLILVSGGNIQPEVHADLISTYRTQA